MLTITEALAEIKTINKRLEKKREAIRNNIGRDARVKDPLEKEGGSFEYIRRERQAITDLESRIVALRTAIQKSNLETTVIISDNTKTVAEWLTWRREVSPGSKSFLGVLTSGLQNVRANVQKQGGRSLNPSSESEAKPGDVVAHLDEAALLSEVEKMETVLGELDGKLSLLNATTVVNA